MAFPSGIEPVFGDACTDLAECYDHSDNLSHVSSSICDVSSSVCADGNTINTGCVTITDSTNFQIGSRNIFNGNVEVTLMLGRDTDTTSPQPNDNAVTIEAVRHAIGAPVSEKLQQEALCPPNPRRNIPPIKGITISKIRLRWSVGLLSLLIVAIVATVLGTTLRFPEETLQETPHSTTPTIQPGPACASRDWQCADGQCINAATRCDGQPDCSDGSDEDVATCDGLPSIHLRVGDFVAVSTRLKRAEHGFPEFHLCGSSCAVGAVYGADSSGHLHFTTYTSCNLRGASCIEDSKDEPASWQAFSDGDYQWVAMLSKTELAVWRQGDVGRVAIGINEGINLTLRVRPHYWTTDMAVEFNAFRCPTDEWQCANSKCIPPSRRCDGVEDCSDGSDEFHDSCVRIPSVPLVEGQRLNVSIEFDRLQHRKIMFIVNGGLCTWLSVEGANQTGALWYSGSSGCLECTRREPYCDDILQYPGHLAVKNPTAFPSGTMHFVVELRPSDVVALWRPGYENQPVLVNDFFEESVVLTVQPYFWTVNMPVQFRGVTCGRREAQCLDGRCISSEMKCNGFDDCGDGSDETGCNSIATASVEEDQVVTASVRLEDGHGWPVILACFDWSCVRLDIYCIDSSGAIGLESQHGCNLQGAGCVKDHENNRSYPEDCVNLTAGDYNFTMVPRVLVIDEDTGFEALHLVVWLTDSEPDIYVSVVMEIGRNKFVYATGAPAKLPIKIRPNFWTTDMSVQFYDTPLPP